MKRRALISDETLTDTFAENCPRHESPTFIFCNIEILIDFLQHSVFFFAMEKLSLFSLFPKPSPCDLYFHSVCKYFNTIESRVLLRSRLSGIFSFFLSKSSRKLTSGAFLRRASCDCVRIFQWKWKKIPCHTRKGTHTLTESRENSSNEFWNHRSSRMRTNAG